MIPLKVSRKHTYENPSRLGDICKDISGGQIDPSLGVYVDQKSLVFPGLNLFLVTFMHLWVFITVGRMSYVLLDCDHFFLNRWFVECERKGAEDILRRCSEDGRGNVLMRLGSHGDYAISARTVDKQGYVYVLLLKNAILRFIAE